METKRSNSKENRKRNGEKPDRSAGKSTSGNKAAGRSYGKTAGKKGYLHEKDDKVKPEEGRYSGRSGGTQERAGKPQVKSGSRQGEGAKSQAEGRKPQVKNAQLRGEGGKLQMEGGKPRRESGKQWEKRGNSQGQSGKQWEKSGNSRGQRGKTEEKSGRRREKAGSQQRINKDLQERWENPQEKNGNQKKKNEKLQDKNRKSDGKTGNWENRKKELSEKKSSRCKVSGECGGCQRIDMPYDEQLAMKQKEVAKILKPFVKLEGIIGMEKPEHYRNKVNAAFTHDRKGKPLSGVYKEGTHYIVPIEECLLENEKADKIIGSIRELLPSFKIKTYDEDTGYGLLRHVMVRVGHASGQIMVVLVLSSPIMPSKNNFVKALLKLHPDITTIVINANDRRTSMVLGDKEQVIYGKGYIEDTLNGKLFKISPKSFYQINSVQTEKLYGKAIEYAGLTGKETILDAYCGIGTIGIMAADRAKQVIGVELNKDAVKDAIINAKQNKISNIQFYQKDAGEFMVQLAEQGQKIDTVFMDPPRAGSDEVFLDSLAALKPEKIVYVSCNPETLARDLQYLVKKGYRGERGVAVDMFPFTNHVETVVLLSRTNK